MKEHYRGDGEMFRPNGGASLGNCEYNLSRNIDPRSAAGKFDGKLSGVPAQKLREWSDLSTELGKRGKSSDQLQLWLGTDQLWVDLVIVLADGYVVVSGHPRKER